MQITNEELLQDLVERTQVDIKRAESMLQLPVQQLNQRPSPKAWSALECVEHLNRYGDFYLPEISEQLKGSKKVESSQLFVSSWLGDYFAKIMLPKPNLNKMKTFSSMNPQGSSLDMSVLEKFIRQEQQMLELLNQSTTADLKRTKTSITISKLIKLRLGDTFRVVIYHNNRHMLQAQRACGITD